METLKVTAQNVEAFNKIYESDRFKARIYCFENTPEVRTTFYNNDSPGKFQVFSEVKKFGVSKSLKLYASKKSVYKLIVNHKTFYRHAKNTIMPITFGVIETIVRPVFIKHFPWIEFLQQHNIGDISFNTIVSKKLYTGDKLLRFMYGCATESALQIRRKFPYKDWKLARRNITNVENINADLLCEDELFADSVQLAYKLNESVNASWSVRRLREEHDKWTKIYTNIVMELTNRRLIIHPIFQSFNDFVGGGLLSSTAELAIEGKTQNHCVATYTHPVESGKCAIFHFDGYTAEILNTGKSLELRQFRGYRNSEAPVAMRSVLNEKILAFCRDKKIDDFKLIANRVTILDEEVVDLPF